LAVTEIRVPDLGNFKDVEIIDVLVKAGDAVALDAPLLTLETEKATMDVPSTAAGVIEQLHVHRGVRVSTGDLIATLQVGAPTAVTPAAAPPAPAPTAPATPAPPAAAPAAAVPSTPPPAAMATTTAAAVAAGAAAAHASPSVRHLARELGVDLARVVPSGPKGRVLDVDVKRYVKEALGAAAAPAAGVAAAPGAALPAVASVDFTQFGAVEVQKLGRIQRIAGARLHAAWVNLPHVTQFEQADITELEEARKWLGLRARQEGVKLTPLAFILRACVKALREFPRFNASLDASGENLVLKQYLNIGFAADTPAGLVVPVIHGAGAMDVFALARALATLSEKARAGKLAVAEMQGGCFTVSSLGGIGGTAFTPIINAPEVAILGVSRSSLQPVWRDGAFVPRLMLPLSLSYDHRVIDGAAAARFTSFLAQALADVAGLMEPPQ
jgi:pyruvate dehydrogenase E2 component (dihydrolipoamide acetyltransferase)